MTTYNITPEIEAKYSDVEEVSDQVAYGLGNDNDIIAKVFQKNGYAACYFAELLEPLVKAVENIDECDPTNKEYYTSQFWRQMEYVEGYRKVALDTELADRYLNMLNSEEFFGFVDTTKKNLILASRDFLNDLAILMGSSEALACAARFDPDAW